MTQPLVKPKLALFGHPVYVDLAMRLDNYTNAIDDNPSHQSCRVLHVFSRCTSYIYLRSFQVGFLK
ncbi:hypothetical protein HanIR_Chr04g0164201 [Helianthus annuus]|nr:hypothetical protein HanIR_Chr04g0164201 [Helianthus annuus]